MKKVYIIYSMVIALAAFTFSCEEVESPPQFAKSEAEISISSSDSEVAVSASDSLSDVISLTWNDPKYAVGLGKSKFTVRVGAEGENFTNFLSKEFTGVLTGSLKGKELNGMALRLGGTIGEPITLDVMVVASQSNNNEMKNSNVLQITVTPYGDLGLSPSSADIELDATKASDEGLKLTWSTAFVGFTGVKTYQLQYAKGGTDFAATTNVDVTSFSKSFTHFELNKIALSYGIAAGSQGTVDFRVKATNELGAVVYSNTSTITLSPYIAFISIGIIGDATPGDWTTDTDMYRPDASKPTEWTVTVYLIGGKAAKFRADDDWADNWGSADFPTGTGTQNGANIPINNSGYYKVNLNVGTGAYSFTPVASTAYTNISLIGAQTGWGSDIADLTKDPSNNQIWTGIVNLTAGELKFRANHDWATSWGTAAGAAADALSGYSSTAAVSNLVISTPGDYFVYINVASGEYFFGKADRNVAYADVGVIGSGSPGGWDSDTNLIRNPSNPYKWSGTITLTNGEAKFRANDDWGVNWGGSTFPGGVGTSNGPNIPVTAGTYFITMNSATGEYFLLK